MNLADRVPLCSKAEKEHGVLRMPGVCSHVNSSRERRAAINNIPHTAKEGNDNISLNVFVVQSLAKK